jgi:hypothetical protein
MATAAAGALDEVHEIWVWLAEELLAVNEALKSHVDADVVALSQLIQSSAKAVVQIRLLGILGRAYVKVGKNGSKYIIFKGFAGLRPNLQGTRYAATNPKVAAFVVGGKDIIADAAKATKIAVIAFVAIDIIQELQGDSFSLASLGVRVLSDVLQAIVAAGAAAAVGVVLTVVGVPTVVAFVVVVATGFAVGVILTELDRRYKLTEMARARMMAYERELQENIWNVQQRVNAARQGVGQAVRQGEQAISDAMAVYYAVNRVWRTVEEFLHTGYLIR